MNPYGTLQPIDDCAISKINIKPGWINLSLTIPSPANSTTVFCLHWMRWDVVKNVMNGFSGLHNAFNISLLRLMLCCRHRHGPWLSITSSHNCASGKLPWWLAAGSIMELIGTAGVQPNNWAFRLMGSHCMMLSPHLCRAIHGRYPSVLTRQSPQQ